MKTKQKNSHIFCIDSDGCVLNTMNNKHMNYFGPYAAEEWNVQNKNKFLEIWNTVNLHSMTRGTNRFLSLVKVFDEMHKIDPKVLRLKDVDKWTKKTSKLSNQALEDELKSNASLELTKVLNWSNRVNKSLSQQKVKAFDEAVKCLKEIAKISDIAIVSSGNKEAIVKEWTENKIIDFVKHLFSQEDGSKSVCIKKLIDQEGYDKNNILMIGDAPGDLKAAEANDVGFYPIIYDRENECWNELRTNWLTKFVNNKISKADINKLKDNFLKTLGEK